MGLLTNKTLGGGVTSHPQGKFYMVRTYKCIISTTTSLEIVVSTFVEQGQPWPFSLELLPETWRLHFHYSQLQFPWSSVSSGSRRRTKSICDKMERRPVKGLIWGLLACKRCVQWRLQWNLFELELGRRGLHWPIEKKRRKGLFRGDVNAFINETLHYWPYDAKDRIDGN